MKKIIIGLIIVMFLISGCAADKQDKVSQKNRIGDEILISNLIKIKINSVSTNEIIGSYEPEKDNNIFLIIDVSVENVGLDVFDISSDSFILKDNEGYKHTRHSHLGAINNYFVRGDILINDSIRGKIFYDVPKDKNYTIIFDNPTLNYDYNIKPTYIEICGSNESLIDSNILCS